MFRESKTIEVGTVPQRGSRSDRYPKFEEVDVLVDAGATVTIVERSVFERLGIIPTSRRLEVECATGERIELEVVRAAVRGQGKAPVNVDVIFGEETGDVVLGAGIEYGTWTVVTYTPGGRCTATETSDKPLTPTHGIIYMSPCEL